LDKFDGINSVLRSGCGAVLGARAVLVRVNRQGADEIAGEQKDRDYGKNAGTFVLFRNALYVTGTIWSVMRIGIEAAVAQYAVVNHVPEF
jgi:hypothetical protein